MKRIATQDPGNEYGVPYMIGTTGIGYNLGPGVQAGKHQQDEGLRRDHPGHAGGHDPDRAALPGPGPAQRRPGRAAEGGRPAEVDPSVRPEFPLLAVRGLAGQWRHLPGGRLVG
ncbi:hypothetical protein G6F59_017787 [Rhizopus arrhizus]|nr:hypothetical protein G6F59_017787 [Rhizopus arrhizus]